MYHTLSTSLSYDWGHVRVDGHPPTSPPPLPPQITTNLISFSTSLFLKYNWLKILSSFFITGWLDISTHVKTITMINLVTCHHTKILHSYWLYSPYCTFPTCDNQFVLELYTSWSPSPISLLSYPHLPSGNHLLVLRVYSSVSVLWCVFICLVF